jgi:tight adherence protein C
MNHDSLLMATAATLLATCLSVVLAVRAFLRARLAAAEEAEALEAKSREADAHAAAKSQARLSGLASILRPKTLEELSELRRRLSRAGMRSQEAVDLFSTWRVLAMFGGVLLFFALLAITRFGPDGMIMGSVALALGFYAPQVWLNLRVSSRQEKLEASLPPTLDLLVTCMEAGLGLEQALARVAGEIGFSDVEMSEELSVVVGEMRAGLSVGDAFRKLADRVTADEIRNLSNVIVQSATLGASLGRTLREYASSARRRRVLALEESAGKVTAGLTLPLTLCLLPSAILAMLGPAVVIIIRTLFESNGAF